MPACPQCSAQCPDDVAFCVECGSRLSVASRTIAAGSRAAAEKAHAQSPRHSSPQSSPKTPIEADSAVANMDTVTGSPTEVTTD